MTLRPRNSGWLRHLMSKIYYTLINKSGCPIEVGEAWSVDEAEETIRDFLDENSIGLIQSDKDVIHYQLTVHRYQEYVGAPQQVAYVEQMHVIKNETIKDFLSKFKATLIQENKQFWPDSNFDIDFD